MVIAIVCKIIGMGSSPILAFKTKGVVVQLVEHPFCIRGVVGSSPAGSKVIVKGTKGSRGGNRYTHHI